MRKSILLIVLGMMSVGTTIGAEQGNSLIRQDLESGRISEPDAVFFEAMTVLNPSELPSRYRSPQDDWITKCMTILLSRIHNMWEEFSESQQKALSTFAFRPRLDLSYVSPGGLFRVHYDTSGTNAVSQADLNSDGIPDYVERTAEYLEQAYDIQNTQMGFKDPPRDNVDGPEWDAYIENLPNTYGWTTPDVQVGFNPDRYTSFIRLDNNYTHTFSTGLDGLKVTAAHEYFHVVQFGYVSRDEDNNAYPDDAYIMEASATWMEDVVYDGVNDYVNYLDTFFERTNVQFDKADGWREYGLSIWFHFLEKRYPGFNLPRLFWEAMENYAPMPAFDIILQNQGTSFGTQLNLFHAWNYMTGSRADTIRFYPEGHLYPETVLDDSQVFDQDTMTTTTIRPSAARYFHYTDAEDNAYTLIPTNTGMPSMLTGECHIPFVSDGLYPEFTEIGNGIRTGLLSEDDVIWELMAVVRDANGFHRMIPVVTSSGSQFGSISGHIWEDTNRDGIFENVSETGISGVTLSLTETGEDGVFDTEDDVKFPVAVTQLGGRYRFPALEAGEFRIEVLLRTLPDGYVSTAGDMLQTATLEEGEDLENVDYPAALLEWRPAAFPQPFSPSEHEEVKIPFDQLEPGSVRLTLFTASGLQIFNKTQYFTEGLHFFGWDGLDDSQQAAPGGVYIYVLEGDAKVIRTDKIALIR